MPEDDDRSRFSDEPVYMIGVAAKLAHMHPQTLRLYERCELVAPGRSLGNTRMYSDRDIALLKFIRDLTHEQGLNLAGVRTVIEMRGRIDALEEALEEGQRELAEAERRMREEIEAVRRELRHEIVLVPRGALQRRSG